MFADGSRMEDGAAGYAVVLRKGESWAGIKTNMGYDQEAYDAECAALMRTLESAARTQPRNGSRSSRMCRRPSDGWHRTNLALGNNTPCMRGSTLPLCAGLGQASSLKFGGAHLTKESRATRGRRVGEDRGRGAGHPRSRMAGLL